MILKLLALNRQSIVIAFSSEQTDNNK